MSEQCLDTLRCDPADLRQAMSIHTRKITDSCRDKDCIEDLRVYLTAPSQTVLENAGGAKVRSAELLYTQIEVEPVAFDGRHYCIDITFYYRILADTVTGSCRCTPISGLAVFSKRAVLCGENTGAHIFRSDRSPGTLGSLPTAVVEVIATKSRWPGVRKNYIIRQNPSTFNQKKSGDFVLPFFYAKVKEDGDK